ncbi:MAG: TIGR02757 family protein [Verrucomicrobiota bacterium]
MKKAKLESLYRRYNHLKFVSPDPLEFVLRYPDAADREIVGLVASGLAYGNVKQIQASSEKVLAVLGASPAAFLDGTNRRALNSAFKTFKHRWTTGREVADLLWGVKQCRERHGSLGAWFGQGVRADETDYLAASERFIDGLLGGKSATENSLVSVPRGGSACKRWHLFLRWMIRKDRVDPGCWSDLPAAGLLMPVDTHIQRIATSLCLTRRKQANLIMAKEITEQFRIISPDDPVRYDFALTRLGIRDDADWEEFLRGYNQKKGAD